MAIATFRGEASVGEIADKLFVRLTPRQREKAEAALLKANPRLGDIGNVPGGTILHVPDIPGLRLKTTRNLENPDVQIAKDLSDALTNYNARLAERFKTERDATKTQVALLKSAEFKRELTKAPDLQALAGQAAKALDGRAKALGERQKNVEAAIRQAVADLAKGPR